MLGPLEVEDDGRAVELGGARPRALLAILLLRRNEVVPAERLLEDLYGTEQPVTAAKTLQVHVSRLRKVLGASALHTHGTGYRLQTGADEVDADRFAHLLADGRSSLSAGDAAAAARSLEAALALWRGPPLSDFAYMDFARSEIARLEELRLSSIEELCEARLALGRPVETVLELEKLVAEHPLRERLRAQLMLALYRSGRQTEALTAYRDGRRALVEDFGIEPGRALRDLEKAILEQDPALDLGTAGEEAAVAADGSRGAFVGRDAELGELRTGLDEALAGQGRLLLLVGEPGIGKSRLAEELSRLASGRGARVLVGRCWEAGGAPAYWPWVQALRAYVRDADSHTLRTELGAGASELAQILPELRELFPHLPEPPSLESEGARFRVFDSAATFLRNAASAGPLVLIFDDLHAADEPSLLLLRFVAGEMRASRLLIVGTYRDIDPTVRDPLASTLAELAREPVTRRISLAGLAQPEVARYVELNTGVVAPGELITRIHNETDGNPLFVGEVVRLLDSEGRLSGDGAGNVGIPEGIREVIGRRLRRLSEECRHILLLAAVLGREFELAALVLLSEIPRGDLLDLLDEAMDVRVVGAVPGSPGRLRFSHALIRETLYDSLTAARRLQLHARAGGALETLYAGGLESHFAELAFHFAEAAPAGDVEKATDYARRAGDHAATLSAYEEAARLYGLALTLAGHDSTRCQLLIAFGDAQARAGDTPASRLAYREAADLAEQLGLLDELAQAAVGYGGRIVWNVSRDDEYLAPLLERGLAALGEQESALRVKLLARLAGGPLRDASFSPARRVALSAEALELARRIGDPATIAYALTGYIAAHDSPDHTSEQVQLATELVQIATEAGDLERAVEAYEHRCEALLELGEIQAAKADLEAMSEIAAELRQPSQDWIVAEMRAHHALLEGSFDRAEVLMADALSHGERAESWNAAVSYRLQLYMLRRHQGRLAEIEQIVRRSVEDYPTYPIWRCVLAHMTAQLRYERESQEALNALAIDRFVVLPFNEMWLASMSLLAETASSLRDADAAGTLRELLLPYADRVAVCTPEFTAGSVSHYLALLSSTIGRSKEAERQFEAALATNERIGARPWLAHTQEEYARELIARGGSDDIAKAGHLLEQALSIYRELQMETSSASALAEDCPPGH
jgi:predicted ATPase/DNA-binding SARP family transcriptional activator